MSPGWAKIAVFGMGHVGLPTALGLAELGWEVIGAEIDSSRIALLAAGQCPFYEPGLQELLRKHTASTRFRVTRDVGEAIRSASVLFICVGTPRRENGEADLTQVEVLVRCIARNLNRYKLIVEKSTVPAMTAQWIKRIIQRYAGASAGIRAVDALRGGNGQGLLDPGASTIPFDVASNPEFLQEGKALHDFFHPDRIILGVESKRAVDILQEIYRPLNCPILVTNLTTAELVKYAANAFLATKISFINMVADLCESVGADVTEVAEGMGLDPRIGPEFLRAGLGFGGYCLPKDLQGFLYLGEQNSVDCSLLKEVERINQRRIDLVLQKMRQRLHVLRGKTVGILGLAFKPGTDDIREARSREMIEALHDEGAVLQLYDPQAMHNMRRIFPEEPARLTYCSSPYEAARGAHALLVLTEWEEFRRLNLTRLRDVMAVPFVVDARNLYPPGPVRQAGFEYSGMGRGSAGNVSPSSQLGELLSSQEARPTGQEALMFPILPRMSFSGRQR